MKKGEELQTEIDKQFTVWTDVINTKSAMLFKLYGDSEAASVGGMFDDNFLQTIRDEYDALKDAGSITLVDPMVTIVEVMESCPDEVKAQQSMLKSLEDILEDGISYSEWLAAKADNLCEVDTFNDIVAGKEADSAAAQRGIDAISADLYQIKADND